MSVVVEQYNVGVFRTRNSLNADVRGENTSNRI